jgi:hypothetical protein
VKSGVAVTGLLSRSPTALALVAAIEGLRLPADLLARGGIINHLGERFR